jgi:hypothetical protein
MGRTMAETMQRSIVENMRRSIGRKIKEINTKSVTSTIATIVAITDLARIRIMMALGRAKIAADRVTRHLRSVRKVATLRKARTEVESKAMKMGSKAKEALVKMRSPSSLTM